MIWIIGLLVYFSGVLLSFAAWTLWDNYKWGSALWVDDEENLIISILWPVVIPVVFIAFIACLMFDGLLKIMSMFSGHVNKFYRSHLKK